jgi:hypothetical protein
LTEYFNDLADGNDFNSKSLPLHNTNTTKSEEQSSTTLTFHMARLAFNNDTMSLQSWSIRGHYMPVSDEAAKALKEGTYKPTSFYFLRLITSLAKLDDESRLVMDGDKLVSKSNVPHRQILSFDDLSTAYFHGIANLLQSWGDMHRVIQYSKLWTTVTQKHASGAPFHLILSYWEAMRSKHYKVDDNVGDIDNEVQQQYSELYSAWLYQQAIAPASSSRYAPSAAAGPNRQASGAGVGSSSNQRTARFCLKFNDLLPCAYTPCTLPHVCCRCGGDHAANAVGPDGRTVCRVADPRLGGSTPRSKRGKGKRF